MSIEITDCVAREIREWLEAEYGNHLATRDEIDAFMRTVISTSDDRVVSIADIIDASFTLFREKGSA